MTIFGIIKAGGRLDQNGEKARSLVLPLRRHLINKFEGQNILGKL